MTRLPHDLQFTTVIIAAAVGLELQSRSAIMMYCDCDATLLSQVPTHAAELRLGGGTCHGQPAAQRSAAERLPLATGPMAAPAGHNGARRRQLIPVIQRADHN
jgi:hypothetical protein